MMFRGYEITTRMIAGAIMVVALFLLIAFAVSQCSSKKTAKKQNEVTQGQAGAAIDAGAEATNTIGNVAESDAATDLAVAQGQAEIRAASKGQKGAAAKRAACRLKAYKDTPQCAQQ